MSPLPPKRRWRAIVLATLVLVPSYWALLSGVVSVASVGSGGPTSGPLIAFGLALLPFVFVVLAFASEHPKAPGAILRAMLLAIVVGVPVSALAADAVTGFVAAVGAGGIAALRSDLDHRIGARIIAVVAVSVYMFVSVRIVPEVALLLAPALPFTSVGVADHLTELRRERRASTG